MGHATTVIKLDTTELPASYTTRTIMDRAVRKWQEESADRWASSLHTYPELSPIASEKVAQLAIEEIEGGRAKSKIVPLTSDYAEKVVTQKLEVSGSELAEIRREGCWKLLQQGRFGSNAVRVEIAQLPKARAPRAEATEGKTVTLYRIVDKSGWPVRELQPSYPSQAEARSAAIEHMKLNPSCDSLAVEAFIRKDTGKDALVTITRPEPETATITVKVTTQTPKPQAKVAGYLVAFDIQH